MDSVAVDWERETLSWWCGVAGNAPPLRIVGAHLRGLFFVSPRSGVTVSTDQAEGIALFAGIASEQYLRACAALGLTQWRALELNPMLVVEDFAHAEPDDCLFARRACKADYALAFERPVICPGCVEFYRCLGAEREIATAVELLRSLRQPAFS